MQTITKRHLFAIIKAKGGLVLRKILVMCLLTIFLLAGCNTGSSSENSSETQESSTKTTATSNDTSSTTNDASDSTTEESSSSLDSTTHSLSTVDSSDVNKADTVSSSEFGGYATFYFNGMNVPDSININTNTNQITFNVNTNAEAVYSLTMANAPVRSVRIFSANTNEIRTVKVSTQLSVGGQLSGPTNTNNQSGYLYLFHNSNGGLSLATPNYAGNVPADQADVMIEVLQ